MNKILYIGIFRTSNIGDLTISAQLSSYLKNTVGQFNVDLMDFSTLRKIDVASTKIEKRNNNLISRYKKKIWGNKFVKKLYNAYLSSPLLDKHFNTYKSLINDYDIICIGGGNLLMSISSNLWAIKINKLVGIAKKHNKKLIILAVGAGPISLPKSKVLLKDALNKVDFISVRDNYSKKVLETIGVNKAIDVCGDPVFLLEKRYPFTQSHDNTNVAISVMPFGNHKFLNLTWYKDYQYYLEMYKELIESFYKKNNEYVFYLFSTELSDYETIIELYEYILTRSNIITNENLKIEHIESLDDLIQFYNSQDLLIGTRMHSLIIAFTQSLPIIAISWQDKVTAFMEYINCKDYTFDLNSINNEHDNIYKSSILVVQDNTCAHNYKNKLMYTFRQINDSILKKCIENV